MTKDAIIAEIKKLSPEEQREVAETLWELTEENYELTEEEKSLVDRRWKEMQEHPERNLTLEQLKQRIYGHTTA
jgi:putative addiction module component (TIGR02574 family)